MRRTYRSKKESANALDHRDVIQNLDEKDSVFDAYYIQNLKQTKRELSCLGSTNHYGATNNKVRKRKYVKRIVKEVEPSCSFSRESVTDSAFLTPDKSIRVNKAQDLFDQLLNSSSPRQTTSPVNKQLFCKLQSGIRAKTYNRKKSAKVKKFNCSSSDSYDSDKENLNESCHDITDIRTHELVIERERQISPKHLDESINNIVEKIAFLNNMRHSRTPRSSVKKISSKYQDHRLTTNFASPDLSNSPLCSTPFKEKYRGQSIYKFSPIGIDKKEHSPNYVTVIEENDKDERVLDKKEISVASIEEILPPSPIIHSVGKSVKSDKSSKTATKLDLESSQSNKDEIETMTTYSIDEKIKNIKIISLGKSDLETSEIQPFLGFTNPKAVENDVVNNFNQNSVFLTSCNEAEEMQLVFNATDENEKLSQNGIDTLSQNESENIHNSSLDSQETEDYDTCNSDQSTQDEVLNDLRVPVVNIERLDNSLFMKYYIKQLEGQEGSIDVISDDYESLENSYDNSNNSVSLQVDDEKLHDANNSYQNNLEDNDVPQDISTDSDPVDSENGRVEDINSTNSIENSIISNYNEKEERCISFVTTRRRNEVANDSILLGFNNSLNSTSSADCDKTVLSNNEIAFKACIISNPEVENDPETTQKMNNLDFLNQEGETNKRYSVQSTDTVQDNIDQVTQTCSTQTDSNVANSSRRSTFNNNEVEVKPGIVLQPGKKWERSLSIYRRMTMMTDHFDHSALEDEQLQTKGRKYRQSVISTMEMQDLKGSLHNESIISRRSTFVSKPSRSTIRIIKEPNSSRLSLNTSIVAQDLKGFLSEDCDDTVIELSKLSIADSEHEVTILENFHDTSSRVTTARDYVLRRCNQTDAIHFDECYPETVLKNCRKIGEGVYGEVFLWRARDGHARVMKIVPIAGSTKVNGEHQKDFHEIISEIVIAMELSALRTPIDEIQREFDEGKTVDVLDLHSVENATDVFNEVLAVKCVYGTYPSRLLDLWELYDECNGSENDNPAILPVDQQYIVLELANAGQDLESFEFNNAEQAHALFLQVAFGLAVGEEAFQFEHRDLHWGNVLIAPTDQKFAVFVLRGRAHLVPRCGVAGTIIDYSLSRLSVPLSGERAALYNDLATDDGLFDAVGDRQFEVYRLMRDKLGNDWKNFEPYTNILWLHYTVDKMITALRYKRTNTKIHKHYIAKLKGIKNRILEYGSAVQFVLTDNEY